MEDRPKFSPFDWNNYKKVKMSSIEVQNIAEDGVSKNGGLNFFTKNSYLFNTQKGSRLDLEQEVNEKGFISMLNGFSLNQSQRLLLFSVFVLLGIMSLFVSFLSIPISIINPSKFVTPFTVGCFLLILSLGFAIGWKKYLRQLFSSNNWVLSVYNIFMTISTIYVSVQVKSYIATVMFFVLQISGLVGLIVNFISGKSFLKEGTRFFGQNTHEYT